MNIFKSMDNDVNEKVLSLYKHERDSLNEYIEVEAPSNDYVKIAVARRLKFLDEEISLLQEANSQ